MYEGVGELQEKNATKRTWWCSLQARLFRHERLMAPSQSRQRPGLCAES